MASLAFFPRKHCTSLTTLEMRINLLKMSWLQKRLGKALNLFFFWGSMPPGWAALGASTFLPASVYNMNPQNLWLRPCCTFTYPLVMMDRSGEEPFDFVFRLSQGFANPPPCPIIALDSM